MVALKRFGRAGLRVTIDAMLESHHGRPLDEWIALGQEGREILYLLASGDEPHPFRKRSIAVLGRLRDAGALPYLSQIVENSTADRIVRMVAARAMGDIGGASARDLLARSTGDRDPYVRHKVVQALGKVGDTKSLDLLGRIAAKDRSSLVRDAAASAVRRIVTLHALDV